MQSYQKQQYINLNKIFIRFNTLTIIFNDILKQYFFVKFVSKL